MLVSQLCLTLWDPMDYVLPASSVHRILQARILKFDAIPFFRGSSWPKVQTFVSHFPQILYCLDHQGRPTTIDGFASVISSNLAISN